MSAPSGVSCKSAALSFWKQQEGSHSPSPRRPRTPPPPTPVVEDNPSPSTSAPSSPVPSLDIPSPTVPFLLDSRENKSDTKSPLTSPRSTNRSPRRRMISPRFSIRSPRHEESEGSTFGNSKGKKKISLPALALPRALRPRSDSSPGEEIVISSPGSARPEISSDLYSADDAQRKSEELTTLTHVAVCSPSRSADDISRLAREPTSPREMAPVTFKDPREQVVWELYETEMAYVVDLQILVDRYLTPIRESRLLSAEEIQTVFSTVELLLPLHQDLKRQLAVTPSIHPLLEKQPQSYDLPPLDPIYTVGRCFVTMSQYLKMYSQYCSNQNASNRMFNHLTKHNKAFEELARDLSRHPDCRLLDLPAYLIKPMQRVCKYPLLLREIVKHTPDSHSDYQTLQEALQLISSTVLMINESKKTLEESETLFGLQHRITYPKKYSASEHPIIAPGRKLVDQGQCNYISRSYHTSTVKWWLFTDLFILTTPRHHLKKYVPLNIALLGHVQVEEFDYALELVHSGRGKIWLAWKNENDRNHLRDLLRESGVLDRAAATPSKDNSDSASIFQKYTNRPIPIPPGKFKENKSDMPNDFDSIIARLEDASSHPSAPSPVPTKKRESIEISKPSGFRQL